VLFDVDHEVDQIFFPLSGMVSLLVILKIGNSDRNGDDRTAKALSVPMAGLACTNQQVRAVIQLPAP